jgi:diaminohydroxyphosphoribosylaminopyrimidine deaminase/5-amino-6-(5-phosphoribosylamino)uracil reductase
MVLGHTLRVTRKRPLVQLKLAVGSDGLIPRGDGAPVWVTGEQARAHGHLLRARVDAILVGRGTVEADNPSLTCRLPGMETYSPVRIVLDSTLKLPEGASLIKSLDQAPVWVIAAQDAPMSKTEPLEKMGVRVFRVSRNQPGGFSPEECLETLAGEGLTRLLIEGGPAVSESFWNSGMVDEIYVYKGTQPAGSTGLLALGSKSLDDILQSTDFTRVEQLNLGADVLTIYHRTGL